MNRRQLAAGAVALLAAVGVTAAPASAAPRKAKPARASEAREISPLKKFSTAGLGVGSAQQRRAAPRVAAEPTPVVGTVRQWLGLDDFNGTLYRKDYTLMGVGEKIEVWVAVDTSFPAGDCRNAVPNSTTVTQAQVDHLIASSTATCSRRRRRPSARHRTATGPTPSSARTSTATAASTRVTATRPSR